VNSRRWISSSKLIIEPNHDESRFANTMPSKEDLKFGTIFSNHMLMIEWHRETKWCAPKIVPFQDLKLSPAATSLHYGTVPYYLCSCPENNANLILFSRL